MKFNDITERLTYVVIAFSVIVPVWTPLEQEQRKPYSWGRVGEGGIANDIQIKVDARRKDSHGTGVSQHKHIHSRAL